MQLLTTSLIMVLGAVGVCSPQQTPRATDDYTAKSERVANVFSSLRTWLLSERQVSVGGYGEYAQATDELAKNFSGFLAADKPSVFLKHVRKGVDMSRLTSNELKEYAYKLAYL